MSNIYILGDNRPSLCWCSSDELKDIYVYRRVTTLRDLCPNANLRHIGTKCNPADLLTKNISAGELLASELWWKGPSWLRHKSMWPVSEQEYNLHPTSEAKINALYSASSRARSFDSLLAKVFNEGNYLKNLFTLAYILRIRNKFRQGGNKFIQREITVEEIEYTKTEAIILLQKECFNEELCTLGKGKSVKTGKCRLMQLFLSDKGMIRCRSRVSNLLDVENGGLPILVDAEHPYIKSYIKHIHMSNNCCGANSTLNNVKWKMHGFYVRKVVKEVVKSCVK